LKNKIKEVFPMLKKATLLILIVLSFSLIGCETVKGIKKDTHTFIKSIPDIDAWWQENLW